MANIGGINPVSGPGAIRSTSQAKPAAPAAAPAAGDSVEISFEAQVASKMSAVPDVRSDLIAQVKAEIAAGTYETEEKLDIAIGNMLDEA